MKKADLLKSIAEKGYDVGFGAKKHFATYDIIVKAPGLISFISMAFGIFALAVKGLSTELTSAIFIVLGVIGLYISLYDHQKSSYEKSGATLTALYDELKELYFKVKSRDEGSDLTALQQEFSDIKERYYPACISKQILFSNWYAHYKFFWEHQIGWINEQLNLKFFRDRVPLSLWLTLVMLSVGAVCLFTEIVTITCRAVSN